ncbi:hypothetical protein FB451DRAFT_1193852 [Mycena latifolia]|nr:hypothetical protein FB451DRAFT_1193852 [Mycena latifolia]
MSSPNSDTFPTIELTPTPGGGSRLRSQLMDYGPPLFISRMRHHHSYDPNVTKTSDDPVGIVEAAVDRFWENSESEEGVACEPTFSAAPLSEYYGAITLPGGQRLHHSLGLDSFKVLMNPETQRPFCVIGHEISILVELPVDPDEPWEFEIPFPPQRLLHAAMRNIAPHDPPGEGETGFPMHTTEHAPPMMNAEERMAARMVRDLSGIQKGDTYRFQRRRGVVRPRDLSSGSSDSSSDRPPSSGGAESSAMTNTSSHDTTLVEALMEDLMQRAKKDLEARFSTKNDKQINPTEDEIPGLSLAELTDEEEESAPIKTGICPVCFELEHFPVDCPTSATANSGGFSTHITTDRGEPLMSCLDQPGGTWVYLDDIVVQRQLVTRIADGERVAALQQAHQTTLAPTLNALLTLPPLDAARYIHLMDAARRVREAFEDIARKIETRYTTDGTQVLEDATREMERAITKLATADPSTAPTVTVPGSDSVPTSYAAQVDAPTFNPHRGRPVTREHWSSSSAASDASSDEAVLLPRPVPVAPFTNQSSTPVTEWSVSESDFAINPQQIIDDAVRRVITQHPDREQPPSNVHDSVEGLPNITSLAEDSSTGSSAPPQTHDPKNRFLIRFGDVSNAEQQDTMRQWLALGREHMEGHNLQENSVSGEPIRHAFEILRGPLHDFVDFASMETSSSQRSQNLSALSLDLRNGQCDPDAVPDPTQSPTSLDFSLPSPLSDAPAIPTNSTSADVAEANTEGQAREPTQGNPGLKRKTPAGERLGEFQDGPRKRFRKFLGDSLWRMVVKREAFQAIHITNPDIIRMFAGVRLAILEGTRRIEGTAWHRYGITEVGAYFKRAGEQLANQRLSPNNQKEFPVAYARHPLLFDVEVAKIHAVLSVLVQHRRYELAGLLQDVLDLRLQWDYALSHIISAHQLEGEYPAAYLRYWQLLPYPENAYFHDSDDDSDDFDDESYEYSSELDDFGDFDLQYPEDHEERIDSEQEVRTLSSASPVPELTDEPSIYGGPNSDDHVFYLRRVEDWAASAAEATA